MSAFARDLSDQEGRSNWVKCNCVSVNGSAKHVRQRNVCIVYLYHIWYFMFEKSMSLPHPRSMTLSYQEYIRESELITTQSIDFSGPLCSKLSARLFNNFYFFEKKKKQIGCMWTPTRNKFWAMFYLRGVHQLDILQSIFVYTCRSINGFQASTAIWWMELEQDGILNQSRNSSRDKRKMLTRELTSM